MPILEVELVGEPPAREGLARRLADAVAGLEGYRHGGTWVRLRVLPAGDYAEDGGAPPGVAPVFVRVLKRALPAPAALEAEVRALTAAVAAACGRPPEQVHVLFEPPAGGRLAFGGRLVPPGEG